MDNYSDRVDAEIAALNGRVDILSQQVAVLTRDVAALQKDVAALQKDVAALQKDVSALQKDVAELKANMAVVLSNYVTRADLEKLHTDFSAELCKMNEKISVLVQRLDSELPQLATRAETERLLRIWICSSTVTLFFALAGLQFAMLTILVD